MSKQDKQVPRTRVALCLGSGGARGYAHLGALQELAARDIEVVAIAGTSMGALVGGLAAAGQAQEFADWAMTLRRSDVIRMMDPKWSAPGAIAADRVLGRVGELIEGVAIEDLSIPFTAVATDLAARREVWFQSGSLISAIRASIAIPGVITPVMINGRLLVDGGLMNPVPIEPTAAVSSDFTLAIGLTGPRSNQMERSPAKESAAPQRFDQLRGRLRRTVTNLTGAAGEGATDEPDLDELAPTEPAFEALPKGLKVSDVTALSFDAMQGLVARYRMASMPPDILVTIPADAAGTLDFHKAESLIALGREKTAAALDEAGL